MKTVFFSWITDDWINTIIDYDNFYNSFKKFHPDVDVHYVDDSNFPEYYEKYFKSYELNNYYVNCLCYKIYENKNNLVNNYEKYRRVIKDLIIIYI